MSSVIVVAWEAAEARKHGKSLTPLSDEPMAVGLGSSWPRHLTHARRERPRLCACRVGGNHPELDILQGIGAKGKWPGNMRRDIFNNFASDEGNVVPKPFGIEVTALDCLGGAEEIIQSFLIMIYIFRK